MEWSHYNFRRTVIAWKQRQTLLHCSVDFTYNIIIALHGLLEDQELSARLSLILQHEVFCIATESLPCQHFVCFSATQCRNGPMSASEEENWSEPVTHGRPLSQASFGHQKNHFNMHRVTALTSEGTWIWLFERSRPCGLSD